MALIILGVLDLVAAVMCLGGALLATIELHLPASGLQGQQFT